VDSAEFRRHGRALVDWIADYLEHSARYPVLSRVAPGELTRALPAQAPEQAEAFDAVMADFERLIVPALTHWNHPGFFGYFATSASPPAILADFLAAALNQQAMLWKTSPAATELEAVTLGWLRDLMGLPPSFEGVIYDTASMSTLHALAAAREAAVADVREQGLPGRRDVGRMRVYCSEQAHSSVDKAVILLGLGHEGVSRVRCDDEFRMSTAALRDAIARDRDAGVTPLAVVATLGTTSTTSIDPIDEIADLCQHESIWLHADGAYAGVAAIIPEMQPRFAGWQRADSIVVNPHKWLFVPVDLSACYTRRMDVLRAAFSLVPEYLRTAEGTAGVRNLMDTGVQLGRRFRALKLWMVLRGYGAEGLRAILEEHMRLARLFAGWVDAEPSFERLAPAPFSVVCFRAVPAGVAAANLDAFNERLLDAVNAAGDVFMSHTRLNGMLTLRLAIGNLRSDEAHVTRAWELLRENAARLAAAG
jgi:aromatic-L-amino-acid decarboxylase